MSLLTPKDSPSPSADSKTKDCPQPLYTPHHRNLGVKPWDNYSDIRYAYKQLKFRLNPTNIDDPIQKTNATEALLYIEEAFTAISAPGMSTRAARYRYVNNWEKDPEINDLERALREMDNANADMMARVPPCRLSVARKPMLFGDSYNSYAQCKEKNAFWCGEWWVDLSHLVIDNLAPTPLSNSIWASDEGWHTGHGVMGKVETLDFRGNCGQHVSVTIKPDWDAYEGDRFAALKWDTYRGTPCAEMRLDQGVTDSIGLAIATAILLMLLQAWAGKIGGKVSGILPDIYAFLRNITIIGILIYIGIYVFSLQA